MKFTVRSSLFKNSHELWYVGMLVGRVSQSPIHQASYATDTLNVTGRGREEGGSSCIVTHPRPSILVMLLRARLRYCRSLRWCRFSILPMMLFWRYRILRPRHVAPRTCRCVGKRCTTYTESIAHADDNDDGPFPSIDQRPALPHWYLPVPLDVKLALLR